jgi:hypothetical protein
MYCGLLFLVIINSVTLSLDNLQDMQEQEFEQFEQQDKSILDQ